MANFSSSNSLNRKYKSSSASKSKNKAAALREVTEGLLEYFNVMLGAQLLYKFEREQVTATQPIFVSYPPLCH